MSQPPTDLCEVSPIKKTCKRVSKLAIASFAIAAFIPLLYLFAYYNPWYYVNDIMVLPLDGNLAALPVWLILPGIGIVLGAKAKGQCIRHALAGRWWATAGIYLSILIGITLVVLNGINAQVWRHYSSRSCANNIRQLSYASQIYAQDHQGRLPGRWSDLDPILESRFAYPCPLYWGKDTTGYGYNQAVAGRKISSISDGDSVILFADSNSTDSIIHSRADIDEKRHETGPGHGLYWHIGPWPRVFVVTYVDGRTAVLKPGAPIRLDP